MCNGEKSSRKITQDQCSGAVNNPAAPAKVNGNAAYDFAIHRINIDCPSDAVHGQ
jgi:hypothetical protein